MGNRAEQRAALRITVSEWIDENTLFELVHAMVEVAYERVKLARSVEMSTKADAWTEVGMALTYVERRCQQLEV